MGSDRKKKHKDKKSKKHKKHKKHSKRYTSSSSSSSGDEWVEAPHKNQKNQPPDDACTSSTEIEKKSSRDGWMTSDKDLFTIATTDDFRQKKKIKREREKANNNSETNTYKPGFSARELNPYWRQNGTGLPSFKKPTMEIDDLSASSDSPDRRSNLTTASTSGWRKNCESSKKSPEQEGELSASNLNLKIDNVNDSEELTDEQINQLGAKIVKAEILGDEELANSLRKKVEVARERRNNKKNSSGEAVILTTTDSKGNVQPLERPKEILESGSKHRKRRMETHLNGERIRFFDDDDKHSLKQMFQEEKYSTDNTRFEKEFIELAGKVSKNDNLDEIYIDNARTSKSATMSAQKERDRAIRTHEKIIKSIDNCLYCLQGLNKQFHLAVQMNEHAYVRVPHFEPLSAFHCQIVPLKHTSCAVQLDEDVWQDVQNLRKNFVRMCEKLNLNAIFFEVVMNLNKYPHMVLNCVALEAEPASLARMYFKKAIMECEREWSQNKKLVDLKGRNVRSTVPKGLSYFFVDFNMQDGYAHVIEDKNDFPHNFAEEIIGGLLDLEPRIWRKPRTLSVDEQKKNADKFLSVWKTI